MVPQTPKWLSFRKQLRFFYKMLIMCKRTKSCIMASSAPDLVGSHDELNRTRKLYRKNVQVLNILGGIFSQMIFHHYGCHGLVCVSTVYLRVYDLYPFTEGKAVKDFYWKVSHLRSELIILELQGNHFSTRHCDNSGWPFWQVYIWSAY